MRGIACAANASFRSTGQIDSMPARASAFHRWHRTDTHLAMDPLPDGHEMMEPR
jgi:hypothetical protein